MNARTHERTNTRTNTPCSHPPPQTPPTRRGRPCSLSQAGSTGNTARRSTAHSPPSARAAPCHAPARADRPRPSPPKTPCTTTAAHTQPPTPNSPCSACCSTRAPY
eukprot:3936342-Rhodomonas_salina.2